MPDKRPRGPKVPENTGKKRERGGCVARAGVAPTLRVKGGGEGVVRNDGALVRETGPPTAGKDPG